MNIIISNNNILLFYINKRFNSDLISIYLIKSIFIYSLSSFNSNKFDDNKNIFNNFNIYYLTIIIVLYI